MGNRFSYRIQSFFEYGVNVYRVQYKDLYQWDFLRALEHPDSEEENTITTEFIKLMHRMNKKINTTYFWEMNPFTRGENALVEMTFIPHRLNSIPNSGPFQNYFTRDLTTCFYNVHRDAVLIVPTHTRVRTNCANLYSFLQSASPEEIIDLFYVMALNVRTSLKEWNRIWISTSGLGVPWLHIRIDSNPKHIQTIQYRLNKQMHR